MVEREVARVRERQYKIIGILDSGARGDKDPQGGNR